MTRTLTVTNSNTVHSTAPRSNMSAAALALSLAIGGAALASSPTYYLTELGTLGGASTYASDVNDFGDVVGRSYPAVGSYRAFLWRNGEMQDLGVLPGEAWSVATGINNQGQVVGYSGIRGFIWEDGVMTELPTFAGGISVYPRDINDLGRVCGEASISGGGMRAFWWETDWNFLQELPGLANFGNQSARAINLSRMTAVDGQDIGGDRQAWRSYYNTIVSVPAGPADTYVNDINSQGWMAGSQENHLLQSRGFIWRSEVEMQIINPVPGFDRQYLNSINDDGDAVGYATRIVNFTTESEATRYDHTDGEHLELAPDVTNLGLWNLRNARSINDNGQIVGHGRIGNSAAERSFLLTPIPSEGLAFVPNSDDGLVHVLEPRYATPIGSFPVSSFATTPMELIDGHSRSLLLSDSAADRIWELSPSGANQGAFNNAPVDTIRGIERSLAGYIVGATPDGMKAWTANGDEVATGVASDFQDVVLFNTPGVKRYLLTDRDSGIVEAYDLDLQFRGQTAPGTMDAPQQVTLLTGARFAVASHADGRIYIFNLKTGSLINSFPVNGLPRGVMQASENVLTVSTTTGIYQYFTSGNFNREVMTGSGFRYLSRCRNFNPQ